MVIGGFLLFFKGGITCLRKRMYNVSITVEFGKFYKFALVSNPGQAADPFQAP